MTTIVYFCYGAPIHFQEAVYSIVSALRFRTATTRFQVAVYTDDPSRFDGLAVETVPVTREQLQAWAGDPFYVHRRKIMVMLDALTRFPGKVAFVDTDTFFLEDPDRLFARIGPEGSCLHLAEAKLTIGGNPTYGNLRTILSGSDFHSRTGPSFRVSEDMTVWNSGVIGVDSTNIRLVEDTLYLSDQIWAKAATMPVPPQTVEQVAFAHHLAATKLRSSGDVVYHYWPAYQRAAFRDTLDKLRPRSPEEGFMQFAQRLGAARPRAGVLRKLQMNMRIAAQHLGLSRSGLRNSV